jgi:hypothetical protein
MDAGVFRKGFWVLGFYPPPAEQHTALHWGAPQVPWQQVYGPEGWCNSDKPVHFVSWGVGVSEQ